MKEEEDMTEEKKKEKTRKREKKENTTKLFDGSRPACLRCVSGSRVLSFSGSRPPRVRAVSPSVPSLFLSPFCSTLRLSAAVARLKVRARGDGKRRAGRDAGETPTLKGGSSVDGGKARAGRLPNFSF